MIHKFKNFLLEYKNRDLNSSRIEDFADLYIDRIAEKLNVKLIKKLGKGSYGIAYLVDKDKVIKITSDDAEAVNAKRLIGNNFKHFLNYYDVSEIKLKDSDENNKKVYFILMDYVKTLNDREKFFWGEVYYWYFSNKYTDEVLFNNINDINDTFSSYFVPYIKQRQEMLSEGKNNNISFNDAHENNLGIKKDGTLVYFDINDPKYYYDEKHLDVDKKEFDNDFKKIRNLITTKYEPDEKINIDELVNNISKSLNINKVKSWKYLRDEIYYQYHQNDNIISFRYKYHETEPTLDGPDIGYHWNKKNVYIMYKKGYEKL